MSSQRRIHHQATRRQLVREVLFSYILAFVFFCLDLHFVGIWHYYPSFRREYLAVNAAAHQAIFWALMGPVLWMFQEHLLRGSDLWASFQDLEWETHRLVLAGAIAMVVATVLAWRWMLPLWGLAAAVTLYLRFTRPKDSL